MLKIFLNTIFIVYLFYAKKPFDKIYLFKFNLINKLITIILQNLNFQKK